MPFSVSTVRRAAVALAVAQHHRAHCDGRLSGPGRPAHSARTAAIPACARAYLRFSVSRGSGAAGSVTYLLRFTNRTRRTCAMAGFPGVAAVNRHGRQLGSPAASVSGTPLRLVVLRPGWTAHASLRITDVTALPPPDVPARRRPVACGSSRRTGSSRSSSGCVSWPAPVRAWSTCRSSGSRGAAATCSRAWAGRPAGLPAPEQASAGRGGPGLVPARPPGDRLGGWQTR